MIGSRMSRTIHEALANPLAISVAEDVADDREQHHQVCEQQICHEDEPDDLPERHDNPFQSFEFTFELWWHPGRVASKDWHVAPPVARPFGPCREPEEWGIHLSPGLQT